MSPYDDNSYRFSVDDNFMARRVDPSELERRQRLLKDRGFGRLDESYLAKIPERFFQRESAVSILN